MSAGPPKDPDEGGPTSPEPSEPLEPPARGAREPAGARGATEPRRTADSRSAAPVVELPRSASTAAPPDDEHAERYDAESLPRGTQLGRYVLLGRVSGRSSEAVYGAYDPEGDRKVSLKLFHPGGEEGERAHAARLRLVRQAQALAKLSHPCVERIYEAGIYGPWVFLATEFVDGLDLRQWMEVRDEPFPWPEVLRVYREAGRGLAAAHKLGIVHRDFKPSNAILGKEGRLVVIDFGLAQEVEEEQDDIDISELRESLVVAPPAEDAEASPGMSGTPAYMAPEQHLTGHSDARSDQFSFCVALYEALYGERPFSGNRPRAIALEAAKHHVRPPPAGSSVPAWLRAVLLRGLAPHPDERFPSMEALLRELARDPAASRRRWGWGAALAVGLAAVWGLVAVQLEADRSVCDEGQSDASTEVWTPERRDALQEAFASTGRPWAEPTWRYTELRLDAWTDEWRELSERACLSTRVWANSGERTHELQQACLDRHLEGLRATLEALDAIDGPTLDRVHVLAQALSPPRQCLDTDTLRALGRPGEDQREAVEALHRELAGLEARLALGRVATVLHEAQALQVHAEATEDAPLLARSRLLLGRAQLAAAAPEAELELHLAARTALEAGHAELAAEAWLARMEALRRAGRAVEALALGDYVEGILVHERLGWLRPTLDLARGDTERSRDRAAEALAHYHAALEHEQARPDRDPLRMLSAWQGLAEIHMARGDLDEAVAPLEAALSVTRDALGPLHPAAIDVLGRLGQVQALRGQPTQARAHLEQALELVREAGLHDPARVAELEDELSELLAGLGEHDRARDHLERAYEVLGGAAAAERDAEVFALGSRLARAYRDAGDPAGAREVLATSLAPLGEAPFATEEAREHGPPSTEQRVGAELLLATFTWNAGEQEEARASLLRLSERLGEAPVHQVYRDDVTRWLAEHPFP
jgi:tRNA A-37 threonylcarbamoyl transferase component Bud32/tetratricopeptide (TPR) repeat protein